MKTFARLALMLIVVAGSFGCAGKSEDTVSANAVPANAVAANAVAPVVPSIPLIPSGTQLHVLLVDAIDTSTNSNGDPFLAELAQPLVIDGTTVLEKGARFQGRVVEVKESGKVKGLASIQLILTDIVKDNGKKIPITTRTFMETAKATKGRDAEIIGGGAGIGAAIGAIAGGGKGAGIGALVGGGAGTGTILATRGKNLHYNPETRLTFTLTGPIQM